ncbi:hypothetical protein [Streptomyces sp. NPDC048489]|uniref:hypothetical protein n=1 Tax=Streptomyces sp. NPDC048489 TaxID=3154504 RepID=UPI0034479AE0
MSKTGFQVAWVDETPGIKHVTFSGHRTPCDGYVIEALPVDASRLEDVTCEPCGAFVIYDMTELERVIRAHLKEDPGSRSWQPHDVWPFASSLALKVAGLGFSLRAENPSENRLFSEFMARTGLMTDQSDEARLVGRTVQAAIKALKPTE